MGFMVGPLGHLLSAGFPEGLETKVRHAGVQPYLYSQTTVKALDTRARVSLPGWQYSMCTMTRHCWEESVLSTTPLGETTRSWC